MSEETTQKCGNAAAMREALENSNGLLEELAAIGEWGESSREQIAENNAAISEPPRNCDVGTAEEQAKRHAAYCSISRSCFYSGCIRICFAEWSQMPYTEGSAK